LLQKSVVVSEVPAASIIALMLEAASTLHPANTSETSVNFYQSTRRNNPEDSHLLTRRHESLKPHSINNLM
jgi:hypothetical protein